MRDDRPYVRGVAQRDSKPLKSAEETMHSGAYYEVGSNESI
jgi:hypothetical protein